MRRLLAALAVVATLVLGANACGSSDDGGVIQPATTSTPSITSRY